MFERIPNTSQKLNNFVNNVNSFQSSAAFLIETSHLICSANQMTGFYVNCNTELKWVSTDTVFVFERETLLERRLK